MRWWLLDLADAWAEANPEAGDTKMRRGYAWIAWRLSQSHHAYPCLVRFRASPPFSPDVIVGHDEQLTSFDILLNRLNSGRTVLLGQFRTKALRAGSAAVEIEVREHGGAKSFVRPELL